MKRPASMLVIGDIISLNRHPYEILSIKFGVRADTLKVKSTRGTRDREVLVYHSEEINVKVPAIPINE